MVGSGSGSDSGAKLIGQRGSICSHAGLSHSLKDAGASDLFLVAVQWARSPRSECGTPPQSNSSPRLLAGGVPIHRISELVAGRGIDFDVKADFLWQVLKGGGDDEIDDMRSSPRR